MGSGDKAHSSSPKASLPEISPYESIEGETLRKGRTSHRAEDSARAESPDCHVNHRMEDLRREVSDGDVAADINNNAIEVPTLSLGSEPSRKSSTTGDVNGLEVTGEIGKTSALILHSVSKNVTTGESSHSRPHYRTPPPSSAPPSEVNQSEVNQSVMATPSNVSFTPLDVTSYTECGKIFQS